MSKPNLNLEWQPTGGMVLTDSEFPTNYATTADVQANMLGRVNISACIACTDGEDSTEVIDTNGKCKTVSEKPEPKPLSPWSAAIILVNTISMGYILNPSGFAQGGSLLGAVCLALVSIQSIISGIFILEACTRAEMLKVSMSAASYIQKVPIENNDEEELTSYAVPTLEYGGKARRWLPRSHSLRIHERTFELSELCRVFLGRWLRNLFTATSMGDLYGITWTLAVVFGSSLSENIPIGTDCDYQLYVLIFMAITVPISCMRVSVQVPIQLMFLLARTLMLLLMLGTLTAAYVSGGAHFGKQPEPAAETPLANFSAIVTVLQLCVFSTAYQFSVPGLTSETGNKGSMVGIIVRSVSYIYFTNLILSLLSAFYFGNATEGSSNLNWLYYHGGTWNGEGEFTRAWWATAVSSYIVLFAALDGLAVYPLICISLGDILMGAAFEDKVHEMQANWKIRMTFRLMACIPQCVGSLFLTDLGVIAKIAGIFTVMSYTICPACLAVQSRQAIKKAHLPTETKYSSWFSSECAAWILILLSSCLICGVFYDAFLSLSPSHSMAVQEDDLFS